MVGGKYVYQGNRHLNRTTFFAAVYRHEAALCLKNEIVGYAVTVLTVTRYFTDYQSRIKGVQLFISDLKFLIVALFEIADQHIGI